jgi:putative ABC transport system ATP-binding protein
VTASSAPDAGTPLLRTQGLGRVFDRGAAPTIALDQVDLEIAAASSVAIIGPSGGGKSTLLSLIGLLDKPTRGRIWLQNHAVDELTERQKRLLRNSQIGWVFQNFNLIGTMTALENVVLPLRYNPKIKRSEYAERGHRVLQQVGLEDKAHAYPEQLSGGQQQRVAIARALVTQPRLILADEPTGNLDSHTSEQIISLLLSLVDDGTTLIVVTHDPDIAQRCDRRINLKDGRVVGDL